MPHGENMDSYNKGFIFYLVGLWLCRKIEEPRNGRNGTFAWATLRPAPSQG